jgi:hypothetical protein
VSDLKALHEADASTRWCSVGTLVVVAPSGNTFDCYTKERAALIVALRNAYADGTLVERTPVGGERMSEERLATLNDERLGRRQQPTGWPMALVEVVCALNAERAYATSLERKPLDGYDWRSRWLTVVASVAVGTPQSDALYSLAAYIEALEAERDWLARWCALYATAPGKSATMTLNECGEQQVAAWLAAAAIARVKGGTK